ncbi:hypothetical protein TASIC1_0002066900 [Trichoderma asperellum]|uniref:F-box domain-containing protein n=1 Tax=Trichoderma asperellum TaxID=101201 RepID=A0A6V8QM63_TRIAP|nr:hypothetical protein TASIC1_0002066900 [Trichoderma asperellum]
MIRTRDEPRSSAWGNTFTSRHKGWDWVAVSAFDQDDCPDGGCTSVYRGRPSWERRIHPRLYEDDVDDATYVYESDDDDEPLEYDSNAEDGDDDDDEMIDEERETSSLQSQESDAEDGELIFDIKGLDVQEYDTEFLSLSAPYDEHGAVKDEDMESDRHIMALPAARKYEHIAGPGCLNTRGFHGDMISAEEMMDCHTIQGIFRKPEHWTPRDDDMDFERTSMYYALTGLSDFMPASGAGLRCAPHRGEADQCDATNDSDIWCMPSQWTSRILPFHPACFELFIRISKLRMGEVRLDPLVRLESNSRNDVFGERHPDVQDAKSDGWHWNCIPGSEYLVANPVFVPSLKVLFEAAMSNEESFNVQYSPFGDVPETPDTGYEAQDPFLALPAELRQAVVWNLDSREVANLRLMVREMPWIYEAWCDDPTPYHWAMANASDLKQMREQRETYAIERRRRAEILQDHDVELYAAWEANEPKSPPWFDSPRFQAQLRQSADAKRAMAPIKLPRERTNWYRLYTDIKANEMTVKGLRNRKRIWMNVEHIVGEVEKEWEKEVREKHVAFTTLMGETLESLNL